LGKKKKASSPPTKATGPERSTAPKGTIEFKVKVYESGNFRKLQAKGENSTAK